MNESYSTAIDVWAVGCVFAEMLGRKPLFPGTDPQHQLADPRRARHTDRGGPRWITSPRVVKYLRAHVRPRQPWPGVFPNASPQALDLPNDMLVFNPAKRCTMVDALNSSIQYCTRTAAAKGEGVLLDFEGGDLTSKELRAGLE